MPSTAASESVLIRGLRRGGWPLLLGMTAALVVIGTLPPQTNGPGTGCDEAYDVALAKRQMWLWRTHGWRIFTPAVIEEMYPYRAGSPPPHPPLGRWLIGLAHALLDPAPEDLGVISITAARLAPALAFGILVWLAGAALRREMGEAAGVGASLSVALMPRLAGHAHIASLDLLTALFCFAALAALRWADRWVTARAGARWWGASGVWGAAGAVWGLALLTKINGFLLAPVAIAWLIWRWRWKAWGPSLAWLTAGGAVFFLGWPWLWLAPGQNLRMFLSTATTRISLPCFYLGEVWRDVDVPWHYPWVMFAVTTPLVALLFGAWGIVRGWRGEQRDLVLLWGGAILMQLGVFSWPGTPVYDGERLFLAAFPCWGALCGLGIAAAHETWRRRQLPASRQRLLWGALLLVQAVGWTSMHPFQASQYSGAVGGLWGAERLGLEVDYWGEGIDASIVRELAHQAAGERVLVGPALADFQIAGMQMAHPRLFDAQIELVGWNPHHPQQTATCRWALIYHRRANLSTLDWVVRHGELKAETARQGVWLARLYRLPLREPGTPDG